VAIASLMRQVSQWASLLGDVFRSCSIPLRVDDRRTLDQTGLGHAFLAALRGVSRDDAAGVLAYLRSPYSGLSLDAVSDLELHFRRGTTKGAAALGRIAAGMGLDLGKLWEVAGPSREPPGFQVSAADGLARDMLVAGCRDASVGSEEMEDDAAAYVAFRHTFATLDGLATNGSRGGWFAPSLDTSVVLRALAGVSVGGKAGLEEDAVQVLSVQRARARRFPVVVVLGLVEGEFPASRQPPSLLSPAQRRRLDNLGGGLFVPEADQEGALFVSAVSRASRLLLLSARDAEDDGGQASRSHFWEASLRLLGVAEGEQARRTLADQVFAPEMAPSRRHYLRACAARGLSPHPAVTAGGHRPGPAWDRPRASLTASPVLTDLGSTERFSPSALESYLRCPFAWFVERVIGAEDIDFELDGRLVGQMLHSVLSATYQQLDSAGLLPLRPESLEFARQTGDAAVERSVWSDEYPGSIAERRLAACRLKRMIRNLFEMEAEAASDIRLLNTEMWVGGQKGADVGGLRILGRIDRVDCTPEGGGLFIFDYKSGSIPAGSELGTEKALQLPLYMLAVMNEHPQAAVLGGAYLSLTEKKRAGFVTAGAEHHLGRGTDGYRILDEGAAEDLYGKTREAAGQAAEGMLAGAIAPRPDRRCPPWCRLGPACRAQRQGYRP
jgi:RecB family exonuclease